MFLELHIQLDWYNTDILRLKKKKSFLKLKSIIDLSEFMVRDGNIDYCLKQLRLQKWRISPNWLTTSDRGVGIKIKQAAN